MSAPSPVTRALTPVGKLFGLGADILRQAFKPPFQLREYIDDGTITAFALWNPEDLGYLAAYAAQALIAGDITGEEGDSGNSAITVGMPLAAATILIGGVALWGTRRRAS